VIFEQRVIIRLPDPKRMQVVAKVAESRIDLIKAGMPATIEIEGLPGVELRGKVTKVNEYPAPDNWFNANVKEYATTVEVVDAASGLRPGMTAKVAIRVETIADALQVPIQAVVERGGKHYCLLVQSGATIEPREVLIGSTNEKFLVIRDGLSRDDVVLMNPRVHLTQLHLPESEGPAQDAKLAARRPKRETETAGEPRRPPSVNGGPGS
jgi:HlyD family secretion protein